jgi:hypothetical protein
MYTGNFVTADGTASKRIRPAPVLIKIYTAKENTKSCK